MKCRLTTQEKLRDLRDKTGLSLTQVAEASHIGKSTIGNYESDDFKEHQLSILTELAAYYNVPLEYLIGLTDNLEESDTSISDLHLDDETIKILKSGQLNNRLLCEMIKHPSFPNLLSDIEIYVDNLAGNWIHNLNSFISRMRTKIQSKCDVPDNDIHMKTFTAALIDDDNYFGDLIESDIKTIAKDIRSAHKDDWDTGDENPIADKFLEQLDELVEEYKDENTANLEAIMEQEDFPKNDSMTQLEMAEVTRLSNMWGINLKKLSPNEHQVLMYLVRKASKNPIFKQPTNGRRRKK